jgi:hypothetical protein
VLPPLLVAFTDSRSLAYYNGGAATVGMIMDWREMAGRPTVGHGVSGGSWNPFESAWEGVVRVSQSEVARKGLGGWKASLKDSGSVSSHSSASSSENDAKGATSAAVDESARSSWPPSYLLDPMRGWIIAAAWLIACGVE